MNQSAFLLTVQLVVKSVVSRQAAFEGVIEWIIIPVMCFENSATILPKKVGGYNEDEIIALGNISGIMSAKFRDSKNPSDLGNHFCDILKSKGVTCVYNQNSDIAGSLFVELDLVSFSNMLSRN